MMKTSAMSSSHHQSPTHHPPPATSQHEDLRIMMEKAMDLTEIELQRVLEEYNGLLLAAVTTPQSAFQYNIPTHSQSTPIPPPPLSPTPLQLVVDVDTEDIVTSLLPTPSSLAPLPQSTSKGKRTLKRHVIYGSAECVKIKEDGWKKYDETVGWLLF
ncbi:hypothetical protein [Absidia glauca]|uniref:Uncharacterized protein n=1 Tax=Absidia glauca TaxID=4829 RepID=A0A168MES2_ABSGL|nr:hypothetical protein [Absidia glauca]